MVSILNIVYDCHFSRFCSPEGSYGKKSFRKVLEEEFQKNIGRVLEEIAYFQHLQGNITIMRGSIYL